MSNLPVGQKEAAIAAWVRKQGPKIAISCLIGLFTCILAGVVFFFGFIYEAEAAPTDIFPTTPGSITEPITLTIGFGLDEAELVDGSLIWHGREQADENRETWTMPIGTITNSRSISIGNPINISTNSFNNDQNLAVTENEHGSTLYSWETKDSQDAYRVMNRIVHADGEIEEFVLDASDPSLSCRQGQPQNIWWPEIQGWVITWAGDNCTSDSSGWDIYMSIVYSEDVVQHPHVVTNAWGRQDNPQIEVFSGYLNIVWASRTAEQTCLTTVVEHCGSIELFTMDEFGNTSLQTIVEHNNKLNDHPTFYFAPSGLAIVWHRWVYQDGHTPISQIVKMELDGHQSIFVLAHEGHPTFPRAATSGDGSVAFTWQSELAGTIETRVTDYNGNITPIWTIGNGSNPDVLFIGNDAMYVWSSSNNDAILAALVRNPELPYVVHPSFPGQVTSASPQGVAYACMDGYENWTACSDLTFDVFSGPGSFDGHTYTGMTTEAQNVVIDVCVQNIFCQQLNFQLVPREIFVPLVLK
jgi:hypothetical protein